MICSVRSDSLKGHGPRKKVSEIPVKERGASVFVFVFGVDRSEYGI